MRPPGLHPARKIRVLTEMLIEVLRRAYSSGEVSGRCFRARHSLDDFRRGLAPFTHVLFWVT